MGKTSNNIRNPTYKELIAFIKKLDIGWACWEWKGCKNSKGYAVAGKKFGSTRAHRLMYSWILGDHDPLMVLDHLCKNRACVNPSHLEAVTRGENVLRGNGITALNKRKTHCPKGHEYTDKNTIVSKKNCKACRTCTVERTREWRKNNKFK